MSAFGGKAEADALRAARIVGRSAPYEGNNGKLGRAVDHCECRIR
jgi:hypothetical protein